MKGERDWIYEHLLKRAALIAQEGDAERTDQVLLEANASRAQWRETFALAYAHRSAALDVLADTAEDSNLARMYRQQAEDCLSVAINLEQLAELDEN